MILSSRFTLWQLSKTIQLAVMLVHSIIHLSSTFEYEDRLRHPNPTGQVFHRSELDRLLDDQAISTSTLS